MKLTNPTDDELNAAFAEKVAGQKVEHGEYFHVHPRLGKCMLGASGLGVHYADPLGMGGGFQRCINFTGSANAVLPWLEKWQWQAWTLCEKGNPANPLGTVVQVMKADESWASSHGPHVTFAKAAVIALLRAHGVEVEFTP